MTQHIYNSLLAAKQQGRKQIAVLIDPDKLRLSNLERLLALSVAAHVDYFFVGGSLIVNDVLEECLSAIRQHTKIPAVLFPGSPQQVNNKADALLLLSLISGRNPDLLIGQHVIAAPMLRKSGLEIIPTGYMLIDGGAPTTASYISSTHPIPANKDEIAYCTALAGSLLGLKAIYMDAGSGAKNPISESMIAAVAKATDGPLIVGGGMRTPEKVAANARAGADLIVVGNALEKDPQLITDMAAAVHAAAATSAVSHNL